MPLMPGMAMANYPSALAESLFYRALLVVAVVLALVVIATRGALARAARAPDAPLPGARYRNTLALWLGVLWVLDAVLQAQPLMATRFIGGFLAPLLSGQPGPVAAVIHLGMRLWGLSPIWFNVLATFLQLAIGLALLFSRDGSNLRRWGLVLSIAWAAVVWLVGEGFGGLFVGGGVLSGAPGSVLFYALGAALLLLPAERWQNARFWHLFPYGFAALFGLFTVLQVLPGEGWWAPGGLSGWVSAMAQMPQPGLFSLPLAAWAASLARHAVDWNLLISAALAALGAAWLLRPRSRYTLYATMAATLVVWYFGQDFGVLGGMGTDPNTGAILLVFAVLWGERLGVFGHAAEEDALAAHLAPVSDR